MNLFHSSVKFFLQNTVSRCRLPAFRGAVFTALSQYFEEKSADVCRRFSRETSLTITYFHTGFSTIIGAKSFHGPVRDGKGWYQLAMVIRHNLLLSALVSRQRNLKEVICFAGSACALFSICTI